MSVPLPPVNTMQIHKTPEYMSRVPLGRRFNNGHQEAGPSGLSLYPVPRDSVFHRNISMNDEMGNTWVDFSNTYEDTRLSSQPYHQEKDTRTMTAYSYSRNVCPGTW